MLLVYIHSFRLTTIADIYTFHSWADESQTRRCCNTKERLWQSVCRTRAFVVTISVLYASCRWYLWQMRVSSRSRFNTGVLQICFLFAFILSALQPSQIYILFTAEFTSSSLHRWGDGFTTKMAAITIFNIWILHFRCLNIFLAVFFTKLGKDTLTLVKRCQENVKIWWKSGKNAWSKNENNEMNCGECEFITSSVKRWASEISCKER